MPDFGPRVDSKFQNPSYRFGSILPTKPVAHRTSRQIVVYGMFSAARMMYNVVGSPVFFQTPTTNMAVAVGLFVDQLSLGG